MHKVTSIPAAIDIDCEACAHACGNCDALLGIPGAHVLDVDTSGATMVVTVETDAGHLGCPSCGVIGAGHGRDVVELVDAPWAGRPVRLVWRKRRGLCRERRCNQLTFVEDRPEIAASRASLTTRAVMWAVGQMRRENASVEGLARQLDLSWRPVWRAVEKVLDAAAADESRFEGVEALGVDEHARHHGDERRHGPRMMTGMVDLTRNDAGDVQARLLDLVPGRSGPVYAEWLDARGEEFRAGVKVAALDPFQGYKNAIDDKLEDAVAVVDAFHLVKLGNAMVDDVRCRVQNATTGHRGRRGDPLYGIRNTLRAAADRLTDRQLKRLRDAIEANPAHEPVYIAWQIAQQLRDCFHTTRAKGKEIAAQLIESLQSCPIPEARRLGTTLKKWRRAFLAYFETDGANNGGTEAMNGIIELHRRVARGIPDPHNYRIRMLLVGGGLDAAINL